MGGTTDIGSGDQRRPPKDNRELQVQSCTRRRVDPRNLKNTCHDRLRVIPTKIQGASRTSRHGQPRDNQASTDGSTTSGTPAIIGERRGEQPCRDNLRQKRAHTKKGKAKAKGEIKVTQSPIPLPVHLPIATPPPPHTRRKRTTACRVRSQTSRR